MLSVPIHSYNGSCLNDSSCNGTQLLTCHSNTCVCSGNTSNGNWFWSGESCLICPADWMIFGNQYSFVSLSFSYKFIHILETHCYYLSNTSKTWNDSRTYCQAYGADLMVIQSLDEYNFITNIAPTLMPTTNWVRENFILI